MFNADPDAAALKWDETWCYMAVLIRRQAHMRVCIHVHSLTHSSSSSSSNWVQQLNSSVMLLLHPPQGCEETQLTEWTRTMRKVGFSQMFHAFLTKSKMHYPWAVTNQAADIMQSSSAFECLFIWCVMCFMITVKKIKWSVLCANVCRPGSGSLH